MIPIHPSSVASGTWHYGVVAQWWYEFNREGPELPYLKQLIPNTGQPVLDVGCGAGRLLVALAKAGFDVDGADVSSDMLDRCAQYGRTEGVSPRLYAQAIHELALPRQYRTIYVCGTFGIGGRRDNDWEGLRRIYQHLEPGGTLVLDVHLEWRNPKHWSYWLAENQEQLPEPQLPEWEPKPTSDGSALRLRARVMALDPIRQIITLNMLAERFRNGQLETAEAYTLSSCIYFRHELEMMLERVGFVDVVLHGNHVHEPPTATSEVLVFVARKP
jgi:SAM-dependent methyltransferase